MEAFRRPAPPARDTERSAGSLALIVLALGAGGGILLVLAELSTIVTVDVLTTGTCEEIADPEVRDACSVSGFEQHGGALILLGVVAVLMALGAGPGASRPASVALIAIALIVGGIVVARDIPAAGETGLVGLRYEEAEAGASAGLYLECVGAALCALGGTLGLVRGSS
jgi:hypothetical protein